MATAVAKFRYTPDYLLRKIDAKDNPKNALIKTGAHLVMGVGAGTVGTCLLGKWGFLAGLGFIGLGCYKDLSWAVPMGIGMSASALMLAKESTVQGVEGFDLKAEMSKAKERLLGLKDSFMDKTYMDKVFSSKRKDMQGIGDDVSEDAIRDIEKQLVASAMEYQKNKFSEGPRQVDGITDPDLMGLEDVDFNSM